MTPNQESIFLPVMVLISWTLTVLLLVPYFRFKAVRSGQVTLNDFKCGESSNVSIAVTIPNRVFMNLLEMPVLFYVLCIISYLIQSVSPSIIILAWVYVGFRFLHSGIYLTYNHVNHRFLAFFISNFVLAAMWVCVLSQLL